MKIYLAGDINGTPFYRDRLKQVERKLIKAGHSVMHPACISEGKEFSCDDYKSVASAMQQVCTITVIFPGWQYSKDSIIQVKNAEELGKLIYVYTEKDSSVLLVAKIDEEAPLGRCSCCKKIFTAEDVDEILAIAVAYQVPLHVMDICPFCRDKKENNSQAERNLKLDDLDDETAQKIKEISDELLAKKIQCDESCSCWDHIDRICHIFGEKHPAPSGCGLFLRIEFQRRQNGLQTDSGKD